MPRTDCNSDEQGERRQCPQNFMTNILAVGLLVTNCQGELEQRWTNVGCRVTLERSVDLTNWQPVLIVEWLDCPTNSLSFSVPLKSQSEHGFYRLLSY